VFDQSANLVAGGPAFEESLVIVDVDLDAVFRARLHDPRSRQDETFDEFGAQSLDRITVPWEYAAKKDNATPLPVPHADDLDEVYAALVLGTRDYMRKSGFRDAVIGLSGGIDSA